MPIRLGKQDPEPYFRTDMPRSFKPLDIFAENRDALMKKARYHGPDFDYAYKCLNCLQSDLSLEKQSLAVHWATQLCMPQYAEKLKLKEGGILREKLGYILTAYDRATWVAPILIPMLLEQKMAKMVKKVATSSECSIQVREMALISLAEYGEYEMLEEIAKVIRSKAVIQQVGLQMQRLGMKVPDGWLIGEKSKQD